MMTLRERLVGTWSLISYVEIPLDGTVLQHPLGIEAQGLLLYTDDGFVSAQLMRSGRRAYASGDWFRAEPSELQESSAFIAYAGRYTVDEEAGSLAHSMIISYFPNWIGQNQLRRVQFDGDRLLLATTTPIMSGGIRAMSQLVWRRAPERPC